MPEPQTRAAETPTSEQLALRFPLWRPGDPLGAFVDYALLRAEAGASVILSGCDEAVALEYHSVCVGGGWVRLARERLSTSAVKVSAVVGYPLGISSTRSKAFEAASALDDGAAEIDMVMPVGKLIDGEREAVERDIAAVVQAVQGGALVKVLVDGSWLTDNQKQDACRIAEAAGADFVHPSGTFPDARAAAREVRLYRAVLSPHLGVKAYGIFENETEAAALLAAGANRLGTDRRISPSGKV
jgi:deoxyribose-phosphate aldolase